MTVDHFFYKGLCQGPQVCLRSLREVLMLLRKAMASSDNKFDGTFLEDCQVMPAPLELLTLVNLLIDVPITDISNRLPVDSVKL